MNSLSNDNCKQSKYYFGIDVGGTNIKFGVFASNNKKLIDKFSIPTIVRKNNNEKLLLNDIFCAIESYSNQNKYKIKKINIVGIGFAFPGPVVDNKLIKAININWNKKIDIISSVRKRFGKNLKVSILNDANAATLGEYVFSLKSKCKSMCLITLGTGVGTGIIVDRKLVEGRKGVAGEIAHIRASHSAKGFNCNCGNKGCFETLIGNTGLVKIYHGIKMLKYSNKSNCLDEIYDIYNNKIIEFPKISARDIIDLVKKKDKIALETINISMDYLSRMISIIIHMIDPEVILIGGGISNAGALLINMIKNHLNDKIYITNKLPKIAIAKLKNDAGIYGAVAKF